MLVLSLAVVAAAGCGSSSSNKAPGAQGITGPSEAPKSPAAASTPATPTTSTVPVHAPPPGPNAVSNAGLPSSTPISSAQYHNAVVKSLESDGQSSAKANIKANCLQKVLEDAGLNTIADVQKLHDPVKAKQIVDASTKCVSS